MRYLSTRGGMAPATFSEILLEGLAPDGGLAMPEHYPEISAAELAALRPMSYGELAYTILSHFADDIPPDKLRAIVERTYSAEVFGSDEVTPLIALEPGLSLLRLSNGPTLAFKDIALQLLGNLFEYALAREDTNLNILGATSGDTGSSAEYAMRGKRGVRVFMLSPQGKMSPFQAAQMFSLTDPNIFNLVVEGVFDDCQALVKAVSADPEFKSRHHIGTVDSINWARVAAQVVYYFKGYFAATRSNDEQVSFAVPSGNFGNILAGHVARSMGLPIRRLILATNENDVLDEFFKTGRYRMRSAAETLQTTSPSMDISRASNFERFVFDLADRQPEVVRELWMKLDNEGSFDLGGTELHGKIAHYGFVSGRSTHADRVATIRRTAEKHGMVVDPHTADGIKVGRELREPGEPLICLETALPAKFASVIREALGREPERPAAYDGIESLPQRFDVVPADVVTLKAYIAARAG